MEPYIDGLIGRWSVTAITPIGETYFSIIANDDFALYKTIKIVGKFGELTVIVLKTGKKYISEFSITTPMDARVKAEIEISDDSKNIFGHMKIGDFSEMKIIGQRDVS
jgi:hypothetical protein